MPSGNKPQPELMLTKAFVAICYHQATLIDLILVYGYNFVISLPKAFADAMAAQLDGLMQERRISIANALELHLSCT